MTKDPRTYFVASNVVAVSAALLLSLAVGHRWLGLALERHHDHQLLEAAQRVVALLDRGPLEEASVATAIRNSRVEFSSTLVFLRRDGGELIYPRAVADEPGSEFRDNPALIQIVSERAPEPRFLTVAAPDSEMGRFVSIPLLSGAAHLQVGILLGDTGSWLHAVEFWSLFVIPMLIVLTFFAARFVAGRLGLGGNIHNQ